MNKAYVDTTFKTHKEDVINSQSMLHVTVSRSISTSVAASLISNFLTAANCWELLHQTEELRNEFAKICVQLRTESWSWLPAFVADVFLYQGMYSEALSKMQSIASLVLNPQAVLLKTAGIYFCLGNYAVGSFVITCNRITIYILFLFSSFRLGMC